MDLCSVTIENEGQHSLIDINEIQSDSSPFIATLERCQNNWSDKNVWSCYTSKPHCQVQFEQAVSQAVESIAEDNPYLKVEPGEIAAISALNHKPGAYGLDIRPKVFDNKQKVWTLLDSGSCVSCIPKAPNDKIDPNLRLRAVNGSSIATFGTETISIRLGRKEYDIEAVKVDIPQRILGWDFFKKHSLGFEWSEFGDLYITDKKADTKSILKCFKMPADSVQSVEMDYYEEPHFQIPSNEQIQFEVNCMKSICQSSIAGEVSAMSIQPDQESPMCDDLPLPESVDPHAGAEEKENLEALSRVSEEYASLIKKYPNILKSTFKKDPADIYHRIETDGPPFKSKVRPLLANSDKSEQGRQIWKEMENLGVIERVKPNTLLQYTSPLHIVKKPNNRGWRICADFRKLNQITKSDNYPLPLLRSFQAKIKGAKVFSKVDIKSAFHHLPIHPEDIEKTCVLSPWGGAYVFKRLAFGLTNGPSSWQKYIDSVIGDIPGLFCYLDDILICSEDVDRHLSTLDNLFQRLEAHSLTLALDKCEFGRKTIDFLGYQVSTSGIRPLSKKVEAIAKIPVPTTQKSLLHFLGALNYFRSSLSGLMKNGNYHNAARLLQPLYSAATVSLQAKKFEEVWLNSPVLQQSFLDAKQLLVQAAELTHPDPSLPLALMCDASDHSIGSVLLQQAKSGKWFPLGYMSRHLPIDKTRWSTCRKELLAAQSGLRYFIQEIYGRHCTIFSDHAPLVLAFKNPMGFQLHDPVAQRALMEIGQFTKDVRHIEGLKNTGSDFLSRIPPELKGSVYQESANELQKFKEVSALEGYKLECMSPTVVFEAQQECREVKAIEAGQHPTSVTFQPVEFDQVKLICETSFSRPRPVLPKQLRGFVLKNMHYCHHGIKETTRLISSQYYWNDMKKEISNYVQTCHGCQSTKPSKLTPPHYGIFDVPDKRFSHCHVDIVGPLPESDGYRYILTIIDRTTRHLTALPVKEPSAECCSKAFLLHYVALYGLPSACTSDQGSNFVSKLFTEMQRHLGIDIKHTPIYWPQGNGLIERSHQSLKNSIKAQLVEMGEMHQQNWMKYLPWALLGRRTAFNKDLGTSSSELTLGTHIAVPGCILPEVSNSAEPNIGEVLEKLRFQDNRSAVPTSTNPQKQVDPPSEKVTHVYAKQHETKGLHQSYEGPFRILSRPTRSTVVIKVGVDRFGQDREELRAWKDLKPAYLRNNTVEAARPKRGRPPLRPQPEPTSTPAILEDSIVLTTPATEETLDKNSNHGGKHSEPSRPVRSTRNPNPSYVDAIDFSKPPPVFKAGNSNYLTSAAEPIVKVWSASKEQLLDINRSITA